MRASHRKWMAGAFVAGLLLVSALVTAAATIIEWAEWRILLQDIADQGINLGNVDKIAIGLGSKGGVSVGGLGTMYIDDIRLYQP